MPCIIVGFDGEAVTASYVGKTGVAVETREVTTHKQVKDFAAENDGVPVMFSSSMDFPGDYTDDAKLIARVRKLRGPSPWR